MTKIYTLAAMAFLSMHAIQAQNIGIGINTPASRLHIKGTGSLLRLDAPAPSISFFNESVNLGSLFLNEVDGSMNLSTPQFGGNIRLAPNNGLNTIFTNTGRVGIGIATPAERLDVNGNINSTGALKFNGSAGAAGQVLISNGAASAPEWVNAPYSNTTRFAASIPTVTESSTPLSYSTIYNLNSNDVSISGSTITISRSGLYHFEGYLIVRVDFDVAEPSDLAVSADFLADGELYNIARLTGFHRVGTYQYNTTLRFSNDVYISAPATIGITRSLLFSTSFTSSVFEGQAVSGKISGYLISE